MPIINLPWSEYISFKKTLHGLDTPGAEKVLQLIKDTEQEIAYVFAHQLLKPSQKEVHEKKIHGFVKLLDNQVALSRKELVMLEGIIYLFISTLRAFGGSDLVRLYESLLIEIEDKYQCYLSDTAKKRIDTISLPTVILEAIR